jgi:hypothetical protein
MVSEAYRPKDDTTQSKHPYSKYAANKKATPISAWL